MAKSSRTVRIAAMAASCSRSPERCCRSLCTLSRRRCRGINRTEIEPHRSQKLERYRRILAELDLVRVRSNAADDAHVPHGRKRIRPVPERTAGEIEETGEAGDTVMRPLPSGRHQSLGLAQHPPATPLRQGEVARMPQTATALRVCRGANQRGALRQAATQLIRHSIRWYGTIVVLDLAPEL